MILCLNGLTSLGKWAEDCCLRLEEAVDLMKRYGRKMYEDSREQRGSGTDALELNAKHKADWIIQKEDMMTLMKHGYLLPLRAAHPGNRGPACIQPGRHPQEAALAGEMLDCDGRGHRGLHADILTRTDPPGYFKGWLRGMRISFIYMASGFGSRFGSNKLLVPLREKSFTAMGLTASARRQGSWRKRDTRQRFWWSASMRRF